MEKVKNENNPSDMILLEESSLGLPISKPSGGSGDVDRCRSLSRSRQISSLERLEGETDECSAPNLENS
jgi:hypothetical protein